MGSKSDTDATTITHKIQTGGEITVNLVLTIKLEGDNLSVSSAEAGPATSRKLMKKQTVELPPEDEEVKWVVPDVESAGVIKFGKKVEKED